MNSSGDESFSITETPEGVTFSLHVQPKACRNEICGISGNELKIRLTSPPVEGAANRLCREFLAKLLRVAKSDVSIIAGEKSRHKTVRIHGVGRKEVLKLLQQTRSSE
ncbi:MAG: YggU family protein [Geobacteraceae bacterium]|nr:YggU family protein [Geobacteraceae bacterium]